MYRAAGRLQRRDLPIADQLDWLCAAVDDLLRSRHRNSARCPFYLNYGFD